MPVAFRRNPVFVLKNAFKMFGHTFRGSSVMNFLGLEDERAAFERYREIRKAERAYI
jgi:hypothetical protein